jgi:prepilin-type N-terminal cleavage/methylation domain-containing protein
MTRIDFGFWILDFGLHDVRLLTLFPWTRVNPKSKIQNPKSRCPPRGFTLLEVLIAIALVLLLGGALFGFLHDMLSTRARTLRHAAQQRAAATLIERVEADVITTLVGDRTSGSGVQGQATRLRLLTRGVMTQLASRGLDDPGALGDLQSVEYRFDAAARRLEARKISADGADAGSHMPAAFAPLGGEIAHVRFRYLNDRRWSDSFDSLAMDRLPAAIEVAVWFNPWPQDQLPAAAADAFAREDSNNFDERAFAMSSDAELQPGGRLPPPDRLRVIVIPDGGKQEVSDE